MEKIIITEDELVNAICLHVAYKKDIQPQEVEVELMWDEEYGYSAEVHFHGRTQVFIEANLIEALRYYIQHYMGRDPFAASIELDLVDEEGIMAIITYHNE